MISVTVTIEREHNGRPVKSQALLHENGWQQWGEIRERLAETVPLVEALQAVFLEHMSALDEPEEDDSDTCTACGRESLECSEDPCPDVIADRES